MSKFKKNLSILVLSLAIAYLLFWVAAQIHNQIDPPDIADGQKAASEYVKKRKEHYDSKKNSISNRNGATQPIMHIGTPTNSRKRS